MVSIAFGAALLVVAAGHGASPQSYEDIESRVRRQIEIESDRSQAVGDCSRAMVSWLGMRFTEEQRRRGKALEACADAQRFALRNGVPFLEVLPKVAVAHGGTLFLECPAHTDHDPTYMLYSNCHYPRPVYVPPPPSTWDLERRKEVTELGGAVLQHIKQCVRRADTHFAFTVREDGRIDNFGDAGAWGQIGPSPEGRRELARIERALQSDPKCRVFPERLRRRYVSISSDRGRMIVEQVRYEAAQR